MNRPFFPRHIRTADEALRFLPAWAEQMAGQPMDGLNVDELATAAGILIVVHPFRIHFPASGTSLTVAVSFMEDDINDVRTYNFDLRIAGSVGALV